MRRLTSNMTLISSIFDVTHSVCGHRFLFVCLCVCLLCNHAHTQNVSCWRHTVGWFPPPWWLSAARGRREADAGAGEGGVRAAEGGGPHRAGEGRSLQAGGVRGKVSHRANVQCYLSCQAPSTWGHIPRKDTCSFSIDQMIYLSWQQCRDTFGWSKICSFKFHCRFQCSLQSLVRCYHCISFFHVFRATNCYTLSVAC